MRIALSVDMEGISGTVGFAQIEPGHPEFERAKHLATADVNAAIAGACEAGGTRFFVHDTHGLGWINLLVEELHEAAEYVGGKPLLIWEDLSSEYDAAFLIGYHGRAGRPTLMSHVYSDLFSQVSINGRPIGEGILAAGVAGCYDIPTVLVTGTDAACVEMQEWCPTIETAHTKVSITRYAARCLPVKEARSNIRQAAGRAVAGLDRHKPLKIERPITLEVRWLNHQTAHSVAMMPGVDHDGQETTRFTHDDFQEVDRALKAMLYIAISPVNPGYA